MSRNKRPAFWNPCTDSSDDEESGQIEEKILIKKTRINKDAIKSPNEKTSSDLNELKSEGSNRDDLINQDEEENGKVNNDHEKKRKDKDSDIEENTDEFFQEEIEDSPPTRTNGSAERKKRKFPSYNKENNQAKRGRKKERDDAEFHPEHYPTVILMS